MGLSNFTTKWALFLGLASIAFLLAELPQVQSSSIGQRCATEGWSCFSGRSLYCDCRRSTSSSHHGRKTLADDDDWQDDDDDWGSSHARSQQSQCNQYGRYTVDEVCIHGCHNGKCMAENEVCGTSWAVNGVPTLDYNSLVCPLNDIILDYNWKSWKNIQSSANTTNDYLMGVESDIAWFNRNMDWLFVANGNSSSDYVNDTKPPELEAIQDQCQDIYEKFSCMRNLPECSDDGVGSKGNAQLDACIQACEDVSVRCFTEFEMTCKSIRPQYITQDERANFTCSSLRELECWDPYCIQHPIGEGEYGLGWERDCNYMCKEFQQGGSSTEEDPTAGIVIGILFPLIFIGGIVACCFCCPCCPGKKCCDKKRNQQQQAHHQQPSVQMAQPAGGYPTAHQYQQPATQYQQPATQYQQPATQYQQPATEYQSPPSQYTQPAPEYQLFQNPFQQAPPQYQQAPGGYHPQAAAYQQPPVYPDQGPAVPVSI